VPKLSKQPPAYKLHKASGQARVRIEGKDVYLGPFGSRESKARYAALVAEWCNPAGKPSLPTVRSRGSGLTVSEALLAFREHVESTYRKDGKPTREVDNYGDALRPVRLLFGETPLADFGPVRFREVRQAMIAAGASRTTVNNRMGRVRRWAKWCVAEELAPADLLYRLQAVSPLLPGRHDVRESEPVGPVPLEHVEVVIPLVRPPVASMIRLQLVTGMRPGEVTRFTTGQIDRSGEVWVYRPTHHKTSWRGKRREIPLGPRAQEVLAPWLKADPDSPLFSPAEDHRAHVAVKRAKRKSRVQPSHVARAKRRKPQPRRAPGQWFTVNTYANAIRRACLRAGVPVWGPNRLRHTYATICRREFGVEGAQVMLGHSRADVTQLYAEVNVARAAEIARRIG
jgi:integrase